MGVSTFDKCLDAQAEMNLKYIGAQIPARLYFEDGSGYHVNFGCFEYDPFGTEETKGIDEKMVRLKVWQKYGPDARPKPDLNIRRVLKRELYDYPRPPWQQVPGKVLR